MHICLGAMAANGNVSNEVINAAKSAKSVVLQTGIGSAFDEAGIKHETLDGLYNRSSDFDSLINEAAEKLSGEDVLFVTLGAICSNRIAFAAAELVRQRGGTVTVIPYENAALCAAFAWGVADSIKGVSVFNAFSFEQVMDTSVTVVVDEISSKLLASELKLKLMRQYGEQHDVFVADTKNMTGKHIPLFCLDAQQTYGYYTSVVLPAYPAVQKKRFTFSDSLAIMAMLRTECAWDREQTHDSLKRCLLEECYEVIEAIDNEDSDGLCEELGDVLLQVIFHSCIAKQQGNFDVFDVTTALCNKMISRHTHIFADAHADTPESVIQNWDKVKRNERGQHSVSDVIKAIPKSMPALIRSNKVQKKAGDAGFDFKDAAMAALKLKEEICEALNSVETENIFIEAGDLLFSAVNVVRLLGVEPELALQKATDKFIDRFGKVEKIALCKGIDLKNSDLKTLDELWESVKRSF